MNFSDKAFDLINAIANRESIEIQRSVAAERRTRNALPYLTPRQAELSDERSYYGQDFHRDAH